MQNNKIVVDAKGAVLGRLASFCAKQALLGKEVVIVNCSSALLTGNSKSIVSEYDKIRKTGGASLRGPFFPKHPFRVVKRTIRGMLSYKQGRGEAAFDKIICHDQVPKEFESAKKISLIKQINTKTMTLKELNDKI